MAQPASLESLSAAYSPDDSVYIKSITELGDRQPVVTSQDVHSVQGIKLVNKGSRINSSFYEKLVRHKLTPPLDHCLAVENAVDGAELAAAARTLQASHFLLGEMGRQVPSFDLPAIVGEVPLLPPLAFKLTLIREQRPELLRHSIRVALISLYLGARLNLGAGELRQLATAALFHDVGVLHIDAHFFDPGYRMGAPQRRHLYAHPVSGYLILRAFNDYPAAVAAAVLEHHERLDGSGYPRGVRGEQLGRLGQILAVAEVADSRLGRDVQGTEYAAGLAAILKLNAKRLSLDVARHLVGFATAQAAAAASEPADAGKREILEGIGRTLSNWDNTYTDFKGLKGETSELMETINERVGALRFALYDAGVNPAEIAQLCQAVKEDPGVRGEIEALVGEARWQLRDLIESVAMRWPDLLAGGRKTDELLARSWIEKARNACGLETMPV